ncbi:MAG: hypothetical protein K2Y37_24380 [Pirellulales bacterium]|nr:hypothetical protein [Pirellulales bacterium]
MIYRGRVSKGIVVLEDAAGLPDGTEVVVRPAPAKKVEKNGHGKSVGRAKNKAVSPALLKLAGTVKDLPADASRTIDEFLYGQPGR